MRARVGHVGLGDPVAARRRRVDLAVGQAARVGQLDRVVRVLASRARRTSCRRRPRTAGRARSACRGRGSRPRSARRRRACARPCSSSSSRADSRPCRPPSSGRPRRGRRAGRAIETARTTERGACGRGTRARRLTFYFGALGSPLSAMSPSTTISWSTPSTVTHGAGVQRLVSVQASRRRAARGRPARSLAAR